MSEEDGVTLIDPVELAPRTGLEPRDFRCDSVEGKTLFVAPAFPHEAWPLPVAWGFHSLTRIRVGYMRKVR
jgi:hypothetical protein